MIALTLTPIQRRNYRLILAVKYQEAIRKKRKETAEIIKNLMLKIK